ncbi:hypothetical protein PTKIN_Ptkin09bG0259900 [Pterospermum kingtungense]
MSNVPTQDLEALNSSRPVLSGNIIGDDEGNDHNYALTGFQTIDSTSYNQYHCFKGFNNLPMLLCKY